MDDGAVDVVLSTGPVIRELFRVLRARRRLSITSAVVPRFRFRKTSTQNAAEAYGVKAVMMTAVKPDG